MDPTLPFPGRGAKCPLVLDGVLMFSFQPRHPNKDTDPFCLEPPSASLALELQAQPRCRTESCIHDVLDPEGTRCPQPPCSGHRWLANGAELARVPSINGAEYKQNKAFVSQAVVSLLIYFTVHGLYVRACVFSAGVICGSK